MKKQGKIVFELLHHLLAQDGNIFIMLLNIRYKMYTCYETVNCERKVFSGTHRLKKVPPLHNILLIFKYYLVFIWSKLFGHVDANHGDV